MKIALFSDIHGNREALQEVIDFIKAQSPDRCIFLGDAVGYGPDPGPVLDLILKLDPFCLAGNHDWAVLKKIGLENFNQWAEKALLWTRPRLKPRHLDQLSRFSLVLKEPGFSAVHGSFDSPADFFYILSRADAKRNFSSMPSDICFVAHTHCPGIFIEHKNAVSYTGDRYFYLKKNSRYIINVGSVGQPRDRDSRACICLYDTGKRIVTMHRLRYNVEKTAGKIIRAGLPEFLAERLFVGC